MLDEQSGDSVSKEEYRPRVGGIWKSHGDGGIAMSYGDSGGASRFFYTAKASRSEREYGLEDLEHRSAGEVTGRKDGTAGLDSPRAGSGRTAGARNHHPTVKPVSLIQWLVKMVLPPGGVILDPFGGSGTLAVACKYLDAKWVMCEMNPEYVALAEARYKAGELF